MNPNSGKSNKAKPKRSARKTTAQLIKKYNAKRRAKEALNIILAEKMTAETLKSHLKSTITATAAAAVTKKVGPGVVMATQKIIEAAKEKGGFKELIPGQGDMCMLEESPTFSEDSRIGLEMGNIYKKAIVLTDGMKKDSQMKLARELYKGQTWPCFNSQSSKYYGTLDVFKTLRSSAGANRQGVWYPDDITAQLGNAWASVDKLNLNGYITPLLLKQQYYNEIREYLMSSDIITWLDDDNNMSADIYYAINSVTDVVTFANAQKFLPVELKVYICKCKSRTLYAPAADWFVPTGDSQQYGRMRNAYIYNNSTSSKSNPAGGGSITTFDESSVHLGATPFYSPTFRKNWEVVHVVKQEIQPTDKFELTIHREFRKCHSIREMERGRRDIDNGFYFEGDYALITTFKGLPCIMKYTGTASSSQFDTKEVDASPSRILMTSRSSFNISAPGLFTSSMVPSRNNFSNYISGEGRILDSDVSTYAYSDTTWAPSVMTNLEQKEGGAR